MARRLNAWSQGEGAFDDVLDPAEAGSVGFATTCDAVLDAANGNQPAVLVEVVSAVGVEGAGPVAWAADTAAHGWDAVQ